MNKTATILGIIRSPVFYSEHEVSVTGFCRRPQVELTHVGPIDKANCWRLGTDWLYLLSPTKQVPAEEGFRIQSPKRLF
jgi:hypothetical protein